MSEDDDEWTVMDTWMTDTLENKPIEFVIRSKVTDGYTCSHTSDGHVPRAIRVPAEIGRASCRERVYGTV